MNNKPKEHWSRRRENFAWAYDFGYRYEPFGGGQNEKDFTPRPGTCYQCGNSFDAVEDRQFRCPSCQAEWLSNLTDEEIKARWAAIVSRTSRNFM